MNLNKIKLVKLDNNLKTGGARNAGIREAKGEYIGFMDADDWADQSMFGKLYATAKKNNADIAGCDYNRSLIRNGLTVGKPMNLSDGLIDWQIDEYNKENLLIENRKLFGYICTKIYRRNLIVDNDLYFPENIRYEDAAWGPLPFIYAGNYCHVPENLHHYYLNPDSITLEKNALHHYERLDSAEFFLQDCRRRGLFKKYKDFIEFYFMECYYASMLFIIFSRFSSPDFSKINEMKKFILQNFPCYRNNPYYSHFTESERILMELTDKDPYEAYRFYTENI